MTQDEEGDIDNLPIPDTTRKTVTIPELNNHANGNTEPTPPPAVIDSVTSKSSEGATSSSTPPTSEPVPSDTHVTDTTITPAEPETPAYNFRRRTTTWKDKVNYKAFFKKNRVIAYRISLNHARKMRDRKKEIEAAVDAEFENMHKYGVMKPIKYSDIPKKYRRHIVSVHMFLKAKYKANGDFDKMKGRIVFHGHKLLRHLIEETFSPTVNPITVFTVLDFIARNPKYQLAAFDIKGAFLLTPIPHGRRMFIFLPDKLAQEWIRLHPEHRDYLTPQGTLYMEIHKFLYGHPEASHQFNQLLHNCFLNMGFKQSSADPCMYYLDTNEGRMFVCVHVDDMLVAAPSTTHLKTFESKMEKTFELVKQYDTLSYLGMSIRRRKCGDIVVNQSGFVDDIVKKYDCDNLRKYPKTPATDDITIVDEKSPKCDRKKFTSLVMTLMYLARFTRPDILMPVTFLSSRCTDPTEEDYAKAMRIVKYLAGTRGHQLHFHHDAKFEPTIYADASHCIHMDGKGHGGIVVTLGTAPVLCRSFKLKTVARSSSEAELYALEEASTYAVWLTELLKDFQYKDIKPITLCQDNQSTMLIATGGPSFKRTKHLLCKEMYVRERVKDGDVKLRYVTTTRMPADVLTKPLAYPQFKTILRLLCLH
jgi:hypothetical protein